LCAATCYEQRRRQHRCDVDNGERKRPERRSRDFDPKRRPAPGPKPARRVNTYRSEFHPADSGKRLDLRIAASGESSAGPKLRATATRSGDSLKTSDDVIERVFSRNLFSRSTLFSKEVGLVFASRARGYGTGEPASQ
jgi:hypothetical protein